MTRPPKTKRRIKLIKPGLQLRLTLVLVGFALLGLVLQALLFMSGVSQTAVAMPQHGDFVMQSMMGNLWRSFGLTVAIAIPAVLAVGILATFRFAGPIYRLEQFLMMVQRGERPADCRLRDGDELHDFCALINEATRPLREQGIEEGTQEQASEDEGNTVPRRAAS